MARVLIVDDKASMRDMLSMSLKAKGMEVDTAADGEEALGLAADNTYNAIVSDLKMPKLDGLGLLKKLAETADPPPFIMISAHGSVADAVAAMSLGAADFLEKPFGLEEFEFKVDRAIEESSSTEESSATALPGMVGRSRALGDVADIVRRAAGSNVPVLVLGESGTGKELVAKAVHEMSGRKDGPFVAVHAGALSEGVLESELFGHEQGAFTGADSQRKGRFEMADGGTLFLDELGEIPLATQVKLLRVLQDRTFERVGGSEQIRSDVRLVCATNRNLREMVTEGTFREDLFYRVNVVTVTLPALRERAEDLAELMKHFLNKEDASKEIDERVMQAFMQYHWPGNVRELENVVRRLVALAQGSKLDLEDLPDEIREAHNLPPGEDVPDGLVGDMERMERAQLVTALKETGWNISRAARVLGIGRTGLQYKMKKYGIKKPTN